LDSGGGPGDDGNRVYTFLGEANFFFFEIRGFLGGLMRTASFFPLTYNKYIHTYIYGSNMPPSGDGLLLLHSFDTDQLFIMLYFRHV
jgi:hypothetical protein